MKRKLSAAFLAVFLLSGCSVDRTLLKDGATTCRYGEGMEWRKFSARLINKFPEAELLILSEQERLAYLSAINAIGRPSAIDYGMVAILRQPGASIVTVLLFEDGCLWETIPMMRAQFSAWIGRAV